MSCLCSCPLLSESPQCCLNELFKIWSSQLPLKILQTYWSDKSQSPWCGLQVPLNWIFCATCLLWFTSLTPCTYETLTIFSVSPYTFHHPKSESHENNFLWTFKGLGRWWSRRTRSLPIPWFQLDSIHIKVNKLENDPKTGKKQKQK